LAHFLTLAGVGVLLGVLWYWLFGWLHRTKA
jgi:hypothetical protein